MISTKGLLYIEPKGQVADEPLIDEATQKMTAAIRAHYATGCMNLDGAFAEGCSTRGFHVCHCGEAHSSSVDYLLSNGEVTNSLSIHYLAYHRDEVPPDQLTRVLALIDGEAHPSKYELTGAVWLTTDETTKKR